jgi:hypothetical protein
VAAKNRWWVGIVIALIGLVSALGTAVIRNPTILTYMGFHETTEKVVDADDGNKTKVVLDKPSRVTKAPLPAAAVTTPTVTLVPLPTSHSAAVKFPIRKRIKFQQPLALLDGLEITPTSGYGGGYPPDESYEVELLCPVLGPSPISFRVGGEPTDLMFKGEAYVLSVSAWNTKDQLITVVLAKSSAGRR